MKRRKKRRKKRRRRTKPLAQGRLRKTGLTVLPRSLLPKFRTRTPVLKAAPLLQPRKKKKRRRRRRRVYDF